MSDYAWVVWSWVLILGTWLAWPSAGRSVAGCAACSMIAAFACGLLFRGLVDGLRREDRVDVYRVEAGEDGFPRIVGPDEASEERP